MTAGFPHAAGPGLQRATTHLILAVTLKAGLVAEMTTAQKGQVTSQGPISLSELR